MIINCVLTNGAVEAKKTKNHFIYNLKTGNKELEVFVCVKCYDKIIHFDKPQIIFGLIINNKLPKSIEIVSLDCELEKGIVDAERVVLPDYINSLDFPKTPKEKLDYLFLTLFKNQSFDGQTKSYNMLNNFFVVRNYFLHIQEAVFYLKGLADQKLIDIMFLDTDGTTFKLTITLLGLQKAIELTEDGQNSNKCFVAMSFKPETKKIREAIRNAVEKTGYKAIIIDEQTIDSDRTINDEIIASLKKCKFCVADFSFHSKGVYFESGFALGQGKKVIYTCSEAEFKNAHFDIRPLQHIIYESPENLTEDLINKIEAFIE